MIHHYEDHSYFDCELVRTQTFPYLLEKQKVLIVVAYDDEPPKNRLFDEPDSSAQDCATGKATHFTLQTGWWREKTCIKLNPTQCVWARTNGGDVEVNVSIPPRIKTY